MLNSRFFDSSDLFAHLIYPRTRVLVISDEQYKEAQKEEALRTIDSLERRATEYRQKLDSVEASIAEIKEKFLLPDTTDAEATIDAFNEKLKKDFCKRHAKLAGERAKSVREKWNCKSDTTED